MKSIEFYNLPRPAQERFVAACQGTLEPIPLAVRLAPQYVGSRWFGGALGGLVATAAFALQGFGDLTHPGAIAGLGKALLYCFGFAVSFGCLARGLTLRDQASSLPFARGVYLFPVGVVEALSSDLVVHSLEDVDQVRPQDGVLELTFRDGSRFDFSTQREEHAQEVASAVNLSRERLGEASKRDSIRHLAALDPLCETTFSSPLSRDVPFKRPTTTRALALLGLAIVSGAALGIGSWKLRNRFSERQLIAAAKEANTTEAYRDYLTRGGERPEVSNVLLPRAELREAQSAGTVEAIEQYVSAHPDSQIADEVSAALRGALLSALEKAKAPGTLEALDGFATTHPRHRPVAAELTAARHAVYATAAAKAARQLRSRKSGKNDPSVFAGKLVEHAERHGPEVQIRFRGLLGKSVKNADSYVQRSAYFQGTRTLPSRFFGAKEMASREQLAGEILVRVLQRLFPEEIVKFSLAPALPSLDPEEPDRSLPETNVPTMFIDHRTELSGGVFNRRPRGVFLGVGIFFKVRFVIPGESYDLHHDIPTWRTPSARVMKLEKRTTGDVYEDMARRSFSQFLSKYLARLFTKTPEDIALPALDLPQEE